MRSGDGAPSYSANGVQCPDGNIRLANVSAGSTLTRDTVPVNVDAIVFWLVWNAEKSILEVQAQAERERQARIILSQAETEIAERFGQAALTYQNNPAAMHLRAMNMLYEAIKEKGAMVIVPSTAAETMGLGGMLATASLGGARP